MKAKSAIRFLQFGAGFGVLGFCAYVPELIIPAALVYFAAEAASTPV